MQQAKTIDSFKAAYRKEYFRTPNPLYKIDHEGGNLHHTRLRLGLSHLRAHLYANNIIPDPTCQFCGLEVESLDHFLLRCPTYTVHRVRYLMDINNVLPPPYIASLNDEKIVELFLYGDSTLDYNINVELFTMAQTFLTNSKRFSQRVLR